MSASSAVPTVSIPDYPDFIPLNIALKDILHPRLSLTPDGVSEFTFSGLYLFRNKYDYRISRHVASDGAFKNDGGGFIISGKYGGKTFFMTPCCVPDREVLDALLETHDYWKNVSESVLAPARDDLEKRGIVFTEDRDNFDYLYYRADLAELAGKKYHKKKNHVNSFLSNYPDHEQRRMSAELVPAAVEILEQWRTARISANAFNSGEETEYNASKESLDLFNDLPLRGSLFFINGKSAAYCLGESIARGKMFAVHFEKAIDEYRGIYQFMNQAFASALPKFFTLINREQDLGNEGLRQAKMTYRPCGFVRKYNYISR
jgi:hypothetical protein